MIVSSLDIKQFREKQGLTQSELAELVGVTLRTIQNYEAGGEIPKSKDVIFHMLFKQYEFKSPFDKLLDDAKKEIDTYLEENPANEFLVQEPMEIFNTKAGSNYEELPNGKLLLTVPLVPVRAQATYIMEHTDADYIADLKKVSFVVDRVGKGSYRAFEIQNDSMNNGTIDSIPDGAIVLGRELGRHHWTSKLNYRQYPYWVIVHKNTVLCKQIIEHNLENGTITCHSLNDSPEYQDFKVELNDVRQLFNIIAKQI